MKSLIRYKKLSCLTCFLMLVLVFPSGCNQTANRETAPRTDTVTIKDLRATSGDTGAVNRVLSCPDLLYMAIRAGIMVALTYKGYSYGIIRLRAPYPKAEYNMRMVKTNLCVFITDIFTVERCN